MSYGELKIDTITFTSAGVDTSVSVSGLVQNPTFTGNITTTGTISGDVIKGNTVSGVTVTGDTGEFGNLTAVSGVFTTQVSGATVTGNVGLFGTITGGIHTLTSGVFASGTAANPSITFVDDLDTGIYASAANEVAISTSGTGRLFVDSSGRLGLGTSTVDAALHVQTGTDSGNGTELLLQNTYSIPGNDFTGNTIRFRLNDNDGTYDQAFLKAVTNENFGRTSVLAFGVCPSNSTDATERMRLTSTGLGIGDTAPESILHLKGSDATLKIESSVNTGYSGIEFDRAADDTHFAIYAYDSSNATQANNVQFYGYQNGRLDFHTNSSASPRLSIASGGNVGIGTTSPSQALHVVGRIAVSGTNPSIQQTVQTANLDLCGGTTVGTDPSIQLYASSSASDANHTFYNSNVQIWRDSAGTAQYGRFDSSGRLLVNTTGAPAGGNGNDSLLQVQEPASGADAYSGILLTGAGFEHATIAQHAFDLYLTANAYPANTASNQSIIFQAGNSGGGGPGEIARFISGIGLTFNGDTAAANGLDDYEEGTFTPSLNFSGSVTSITYNYQNGRYIRIGNLVHYYGYLSVNAVSGHTGNVRLSGFPFTVRNASATYHAPALGWYTNLATSVNGLGLDIAPNTSTHQIVYGNGTTVSSLGAGDINSSNFGIEWSFTVDVG